MEKGRLFFLISLIALLLVSTATAGTVLTISKRTHKTNKVFVMPKTVHGKKASLARLSES
jgi:hypothetical protein